MSFLDFNPDGEPEIKIIRNSIINDNKSPPPALFHDEIVYHSKTNFKIEFNTSKFVRKESFGACILDKTGIYIVNKKGLELLKKIQKEGQLDLAKTDKERVAIENFVSRLAQYNVVIINGNP